MRDFLKAVVFIGLFAVPFLPVYVENNFFFPFITGKNFAFRIIVEVIFGAWILLALYEPKYRPKFSWILAGFSTFLIVMLFANLFGVHPESSFMSNFERMDGYITLVHVFLYMVVAGSVLTTEKLWTYFLHTSIAAALFVALYGLAQVNGAVEGGRARVDSRLGNAAYMAVYMLFHIFFLLYLIVRSKVTMYRVVYAILTVLLVYTLLLTGTRGTFLGMAGGFTIFVLYIALFSRRFPQARKVAAGGLVVMVLLAGGFYLLRDSDALQSTSGLSRIANIDLSQDLTIRSYIWDLALEGVKERPILGWGQSNFNYVFNKYYDPRLYSAETWYDRVHNIFLDWLIAGGVLGLITYLSIFAAAIYYLFWQPLRRRDTDAEPTFNVLERGVLLGLLAAYFAHNLVVFDNIISYIFFGSVLALIHARVATSIKRVEAYTIDERITSQFAAPLVFLLIGGAVYFLNVPGLGAAGDIIDAMRQNTITGRLSEFHNALEQHSFADQEIVEQLVQNAIGIARDPNIKPEDKQAFIQRAELEMLRMIDEKPGDARLHTFLSTFYRSIGAFPQAQEQALKARELSPQKQAIIIEQGIIELQMGNNEAARDFFKEAYELDHGFSQALTMYASALILTGDVATAKEVLADETAIRNFALNDYALSVVDQSGDRELLQMMFKERIAVEPQNAQNYASYSFLQYEAKNNAGAIETLEAAAEAVPEFATRAECFIANLKAGNQPDEGC